MSRYGELTRLAFSACVGSFAAFCRADYVVGNVRVQVLSPTLVRIELKGPKGFEDRPTFHVSERNWPGAESSLSSSDGFEWIKTSDFNVKIPGDAQSLDGIVITDAKGDWLWSMPSADSDPFFSNNRCWIPNPAEATRAWAMVDTPRYVPASPDTPWGGGYNVAPGTIPDNGWDLGNNAPDVYVFLPQGDGRRLREEFITLTGRTDLIPLYALGGWDSRYHPYTQQEALEKIDTYRAKGIPLDVFVVDTDWRIGASHGYAVNTALFPNMKRFIRDAHRRNVRIVFNDHPEPQANALDHDEVRYRNKGLRSQFDAGLDVWWYDRNWHTAIRPPVGINKEVFGMYLFHWITQDYYPKRRPFIMANVDGIDNGHLNRAPDMAAHRYNMQWTGDNTCDMVSLGREVRNAVHSGVFAPFAYVSTDLGGHIGNPSVEQYCRWVQYGALSPIFRLHCSRSYTRDPWAYGDTAEKVVRDYVRMRMRLLPVLYAAARENYDSGEPILKRCDLNYSGHPEAHSNDQYLLGNDILVAPIADFAEESAVPAGWLDNGAGLPGLEGVYFASKDLSGDPVMYRTDAGIDFDWGYGSMGAGLDTDGCSVRWTGSVTPAAGCDVDLGISSDDGCRLWIDGKLVIDAWKDRSQTTTWSTIACRDGHTYSIKIEYFENGGEAACRLLFREHVGEEAANKRTFWIPPGMWMNLWTGEVASGPDMHETTCSLVQTPMFVKSGAIIPLAPDMEYTSQKPWDPLTLDVYPGAGEAVAWLYEDDGISNDYKAGGFRKTTLRASIDGTRKVTVTIDPARGTYEGALPDRSWILRLHTIMVPGQVKVDGKKASFRRIERDAAAMPFGVIGGSPDSDVIEVRIPSAPVSGLRQIEVEFAASDLMEQ